MKKIVYTIPCAGGRAANFDPWKKLVDFEVVNLEYPGHWERFEESLSDDHMYIIGDFEKQILEDIKLKRPDAVFIAGHSMGALLAWIIAGRLGTKGLVDGIIIMAMAAPSRMDKLVFKNLNDTDELKKFLKEIRQVPDKILSSSFFMDNMYPPIENDFRMYNDMTGRGYLFEKLTIPCLVLYSPEDPLIKVEYALAWREYAPVIKFEEMRGDHFFPYSPEQIPRVCDSISGFVHEME